MAGRKEEREQLRQHRLEAEEGARSGERRWLILGYGVAALVTLVVLGGLATSSIAAAGATAMARPTSM